MRLIPTLLFNGWKTTVKNAFFITMIGWTSKIAIAKYIIIFLFLSRLAERRDGSENLQGKNLINVAINENERNKGLAGARVSKKSRILLLTHTHLSLRGYSVNPTTSIPKNRVSAFYLNK